MGKYFGKIFDSFDYQRKYKFPYFAFSLGCLKYLIACLSSCLQSLVWVIFGTEAARGAIFADSFPV